MIILIAAFQTPGDMVEYSDEDMQEWVIGQFDAHEETFVRNYSGSAEDIDARLNALNEIMGELFENEAKYRYEVTSLNWDINDKSTYLETIIWASYADKAYDDLEYAETAAEAAAYAAEQLNSGEMDIEFRVGPDWNYDKLGEVGISAIYNAADTAALANNYEYYVDSEDSEQDSFCSLGMQYEVNEKRLKKATAELSAVLDEMEAEIRAVGIDDDDVATLYLRIGHEINLRAAYDDDALASIYTDNRSEEELMESSAYGALVTGKTICTGYAMAYKALCDRFDLPCWVVTGNVEGMGHAWNMIQIDGVTYYTDCTFADSTYSQYWLMLNEDQYKKEGYYTSVDAIKPW